MAIYHQVNNILNRLMSQWRGESGFVDSTKASEYTWEEFSFHAQKWYIAKNFFTWG